MIRDTNAINVYECFESQTGQLRLKPQESKELFSQLYSFITRIVNIKFWKIILMIVIFLCISFYNISIVNSLLLPVPFRIKIFFLTHYVLLSQTNITRVCNDMSRASRFVSDYQAYY